MRQQGVTLIQLAAAVGLLMLLTKLAMPTYTRMNMDLQQQVAAELLAQALRTARSEALLRNQVVRVSPREGLWQKGWQIALEEDGADLLREVTLSGRVRIVGNQPVAQQVRFSGLGVALQAGGAFQAGTLHICESPGTRSVYQVVLSRSGKVSLRQALKEQPLCAAAGSDQ
ncbi:GspH/FimT family pseudopilin [Pseudomonas fontis]|uniref:Type II secretion system protein H n=1 Tax=Pseudomonas fontis TaxID=2942633 RepID=A0ABT5NUP6_9PSED|nr:GspH/FimT family protein [Pseudomonas fontis]MDD0974245.1 GspH/FimT family protein [Pseudomonas fontis]MDD0991904.1 GspH/FimT family protein [Pseudomonas fontis]